MIALVPLAFGLAMLVRVFDLDLDIVRALRRLTAPYRYQARRSIAAQRQRAAAERRAVEQALDKVWCTGIAELAARHRERGWA